MSDQVSNLESSEPKSDVLPITPSDKVAYFIAAAKLIFFSNMNTFNEKNIFKKNRVPNMPKFITDIYTDTTIHDMGLTFETAAAI